MIQKKRDPGAASPGAERDGLAPTSLSEYAHSDLQAQCLVRRFNINPALAPTIAELIWKGNHA